MYPDLGKCLYFDLSSGTHSALYELPNKRLNWIFYINQPEPDIKVVARSNLIYSASCISIMVWGHLKLDSDLTRIDRCLLNSVDSAVIKTNKTCSSFVTICAGKFSYHEGK